MRTLHAPRTPRTPRTPGAVCRAVTEQTVGPFWVQARRVEPACSSRTASLAPRNGAPPRPDNPRTFDWSSQSVGDVNGARHGPRCAFPLRSSPHFLTKRPPALIPCHACRSSYPSHAPARFGSSLIPAVAIEPFQISTRGGGALTKVQGSYRGQRGFQLHRLLRSQSPLQTQSKDLFQLED